MSKTTEEVMQTFKKEPKKSYSPSISLDKAFRDAGLNRPTSKDYNDFYDFWKQSGLKSEDALNKYMEKIKTDSLDDILNKMVNKELFINSYEDLKYMTVKSDTTAVSINNLKLDGALQFSNFVKGSLDIKFYNCDILDSVKLNLPPNINKLSIFSSNISNKKLEEIKEQYKNILQKQGLHKSEINKKISSVVNEEMFFDNTSKLNDIIYSDFR